MSTLNARLRELEETATRDALRQNVARGIALLSAHDPDWRKKIVPSALNMINCTTCMLGQVFGSFAQGLLILDIDRDNLAALHGFYVPDAANYGSLQDIWIEHLG